MRLGAVHDTDPFGARKPQLHGDGSRGTSRTRADVLDYEIFDLVALLGNVLVPAHDDRFVTVLPSLRGDVVADHFEEWVVERQERNTDRAIHFGCGRRCGR